MIRLDKALLAWRTPDFRAVLKQEIEHINANALPLQQGLSTGSYAIDTPFTAMINSVTESENLICVTAGVFYQSVIAGCSCADDPTPTNENNEYCEVRLDIDKTTAETIISLQTE